MYTARVWAVGVIVVLLSATGCATISGGTSETVTINSVPPTAAITIDGGATYTTPASVSLSRKNDHTIAVEKDGYKKATVSLGREFRTGATIFGNILWLLPGVIVDGFSGGMWEFKDKSLIVPLELAYQPRTPAPVAPVTAVQPERQNQDEPHPPQPSDGAASAAQEGEGVTH